MSSYDKSSSGRSYGGNNERERHSSARRELYGEGGGSSNSSSRSQRAEGYAKYDYKSGQGSGYSNSASIRAHATNNRAQPSSRYQQTDRSNYDSDEEYDTIKSQITRVKEETLESTRNSKRTLEQADKTATATLKQLGEQTEQILNIDRRMEDTSVKAEESVGHTQRLEALSKSFLRPDIRNPFKRKQRRQAELERNEMKRQDAQRLNDNTRREINKAHHRVDKYTDPTRALANGSGPAGRMDAHGRIVSGGPSGGGRSHANRYMLEDEDPDVEQEIDSNLDDISQSVSRLKNMSIAMGREIKAQERPLDNILENTDKTSSNVGMANYRLERIMK